MSLSLSRLPGLPKEKEAPLAVPGLPHLNTSLGSAADDYLQGRALTARDALRSSPLQGRALTAREPLRLHAPLWWDMPPAVQKAAEYFDKTNAFLSDRGRMLLRTIDRDRTSQRHQYQFNNALVRDCTVRASSLWCHATFQETALA